MASSLPDILVVTPTLGTRSTLSRTINSVKQVIGERLFHCIVGPVSSTSWIRDEFDHVHLLDDSGCSSIYDALNHAIHTYASSFSYFAYINDDDFWLPAYASLVQCLDDCSDITLVYGRTQVHDLNGNFVKILGHYPTCSPFASLLRFRIPIFTQQSVLCRTADLLQLNGFDTRYSLAADTDLWARWVLSSRPIAHCHKVCSSYCFDGSRLSNNDVLAAAEGLMLNEAYSKSSFILDIFSLLAFRVYNIPLYLGRLVKARRTRSEGGG